jgi:hypothetical protein
MPLRLLLTMPIGKIAKGLNILCQAAADGCLILIVDFKGLYSNGYYFVFV